MAESRWARLLAAAQARDPETAILVHEERAALWHLAILGAPDEVTQPNWWPNEAVRWEAWAAESIVWTIARLREGYPHEAVRGVFQVYEYTGRRGGFLPAGLSDARDALRNYVEKLLRNA